MSLYPIAGLYLFDLLRSYAFHSDEATWKSLLRNGPREFTTSYKSAMRSVSNLLQQYQTSINMDFIQTIPDDILLQILHEALSDNLPDDSDDEDVLTSPNHCHPSDAIRLSHVSRRFHQLIKNNASFWESVQDSFTSRKLVEVCIERSRSRGLSIYLDFRYMRRLPLEEFFDAIVPQQGRWKVLEIDTHDSIELDQYEILKSRLEHLQPSNLEQIIINYGEDDLRSDSDESDISKGPQMAILSNAVLPRLRTAKFVNCIPRPFIAAAITSLDIEFSFFYFEFDGWDYAPFITFLERTPSLTKLAMTFTCDGPLLGPFETHMPSRIIIIPHVAHLQLTMYNIPSPTPEKLVKAIKFPGLQSLTIKIRNFDESEPGDEDESDWYLSLQGFLDMILSRAPDHFPDLSKLTIISKTHNKYTIPFRYLPKLRHLHIDATVSPSSKPITPSPLLPIVHPLETLELVRCEEVDVQWVKDVVESLKSSNRWNGFRRLVIDGCENVGVDAFHFVPREKLTWIPYAPIPCFWVLIN